MTIKTSTQFPLLFFNLNFYFKFWVHAQEGQVCTQVNMCRGGLLHLSMHRLGVKPSLH